MSFTKHYKETMQKVFAKETESGDFRKVYQQRMIDFRKAKDSVVRVEKPTNLVRARELGYKAKQGVFVLRVRVRRGGGLFERANAGRRPKRMGVNKLTRRISMQRMAETRASAKYRNSEVVNSYFVGEDGNSKYFEVIMAERAIKTVTKDKDLAKFVKARGRAERGLTSAGRKGRGLDKKGVGSENTRPSLRANRRHGK